ncbi:ATPase, P-type (Transporting), HAD super, subfamily IC domain protein [Burkholderia pseudomallei]|nr:ATPase, P-type (Transporting), HAD super, subfamily IC domain protein [Burkholderia pseudomallei]KGD59582.1 ATPase, P-type (Transporting), HAD super, subfamily IC domain protein [Burkholderia pseudomallei]
MTSAAHSASATSAIRFASVRASRCSGDGASAMSVSDLPIRPSAVRGPVSVTIIRPCPRTTIEPKWTRHAASSGVGASGRSAALSTGADSPVSSDSSTLSSCASTSQPSAGTRAPSAIHTRSPGTSSAADTSRRSPPRITSARGADSARSAASTPAVRWLCTIVSAAIAATNASSVSASGNSPSAR